MLVVCWDRLYASTKTWILSNCPRVGCWQLYFTFAFACFFLVKFSSNGRSLKRKTLTNQCLSLKDLGPWADLRLFLLTSWWCRCMSRSGGWDLGRAAEIVEGRNGYKKQAAAQASGSSAKVTKVTLACWREDLEEEFLETIEKPSKKPVENHRNHGFLLRNGSKPPPVKTPSMWNLRVGWLKRSCLLKGSIARMDPLVINSKPCS